MNIFQRAVTRAYANGLYRDINENRWRQQLADPSTPYGRDPLFSYIMSSLASTEGCDSIDEAILRLEAAQEELIECLQVLYKRRGKRAA